MGQRASVRRSNRSTSSAETVGRLEGRVLMSAAAAKVTLNPGGLSLADGTSFQYAATAYDATGAKLATQPTFTWSVVGGTGTVTSAGKFTAPATGTSTTTLQAAVGSVKGTVTVKVTTAGILTADADVGSPALAGHFASDGSTYTLSGSGSDIWNGADQFNFAATPMTGDGIVEARITAVGNTDPWAKAGVMVRDTTAGNSRDVYVVETPAGVVQLNDRDTAGVAAVNVGQANVTAGAPTWVKLVRTGNRFTGYYGPDGTTWTQLGSAATLGLNAAVSAGLVATSHNLATVSTSSFDHVQVMSQPTSGTYRIATRGQPNLSVDVEGFANADETNISLYTANHTSNQQWSVQAQGDGTFKVYAYSGMNSLQMLDDTNGATANGTAVRTYEDNGNAAQRWLFVPTGGGYYRLVPKNGENTLQTLDVANGASAALGSRLQLWSYWAGKNQQFSLQDPGPQQVLPSPKKGVAGYLNEAASVHASWGYDWGSGGAGGISGGAEYDPMVWGYYGNANNSFGNWMTGIKSTGAKYVLGLNEPDNASQANSTVANALEALGLMQQAGLPLVSPAAQHAEDSWMQQFMAGAAADGYRVDAVALHWYGGNDPAGFINYVNYIHQLYNKPIWVTEFCPADWSGNHGISAADAANFMRTVIPQLNSMSFVQRYSWFSAGTGDAALGQGALYNGDGSLTDLGHLYARL